MGFVVVPVIITISAIAFYEFVVPDWLGQFKLSRRYVIAGLVLLVWAGAVYMVSKLGLRIDYWLGTLIDFVIAVWFFGPVPFTGIAGFLMQSGLRDLQRTIWWRVIVSVLLFASTSYTLGFMASVTGLGVLGAIFLGITATIIAIVIAIWMVISLHHWRKLAALVVGIVFPVVFFASIWFGNTQAPENLTEDNGNLIIQSLDQYYTDNKSYPAELAELIPTYQTELPEALTTQDTGWLYKLTDNQYTLGYWYWPDGYMIMLCLYESQNGQWECESTPRYENWGPFSPVMPPY